MKTALIVDDNAESLYLLKCILSAEGYETVEARDGGEALAAATARPPGQPLDLVISDILMPVMDGFNLCRAFKADPGLAGIPFVFYTATYIDKRDEEFAMSLGADLFLVKPADPETLLARVGTMLEARRTEPASRGLAPPPETPFLREYNQVLIHKLEEKLGELERANQALLIKDFALASSGNGLLITDGRFEITYANPAALRLTGQPLPQILGQRPASLFLDPEAAALWLFAPEGPRDFCLAPNPLAPGDKWVRVEKHDIHDPHGTKRGFLLSLSDITEERRLRQDLARVQRLEALSLFAAGVAHDFNNLLMAMYTGLELGASPIPGKESENRAMALAAFERARDLTRRLVTFAKRDTAERKPVDLRVLLDECISLSLSGSGIHCERRYGDRPAIAQVDAGQMAQVFSNLLVNARQAMGDRGTIIARIAVKSERPSGKGDPVETIVVGIGDDGPGIPEDILPSIFEPYFTTKADGTGLGLATSQAIVHEHGGNIVVESREQVGTTFQIRLPGLPSGTPVPVMGTHEAVKARSGRLLVMDDQTAIQSLLQRGLGKAGYGVVVVGRGEDAVGAYDRALGEGRGFDLVLLDITVQGGMGGIETLAELRRRDPGILALAMTGYADEGMATDLRGKGFARVIAKPFLLHELFATIQALLG